MTVCVCGNVIDQDECQCSLASSDCITVDGSGNLNPLTFSPRRDPDTDNILTCEADGLLVQLPSYIAVPPRAVAYHNANQSIANDTLTVVSLNSEYTDTPGGMHDTVTNNSRLTIVTAGIYILNFVGAFAGNITGDRAAYIRKNGNETIAGDEKRALSSATPECGVRVKTHEYLMAGEFIEAVVKQDSTAALNLLATRYSPVLSACFRRLPPDE